MSNIVFHSCIIICPYRRSYSWGRNWKTTTDEPFRTTPFLIESFDASISSSEILLKIRSTSSASYKTCWSSFLESLSLFLQCSEFTRSSFASYNSRMAGSASIFIMLSTSFDFRTKSCNCIKSIYTFSSQYFYNFRVIRRNQ